MSVLFPESLLEVVAGEPVGHGSLLLVPLFGPPSGPEVSALADAIERGDTVVDEVSEAGRVQTLFVKHEGQRHLLLLDGSELIGAKQNRIVNTTILVSPGSKLSIPVSCVEAGRWSRRSGRFRSKRRGLSSTMRRNKQVRVLESLRRRGSYDACQSSVWHEVDELSTVTRVTSRTACMSDVLDATTGEVDAHVHALPPREGQTGVAAFLDGKLLGIVQHPLAHVIKVVHPF